MPLSGFAFNPQQSNQMTGALNGTPGSATQALRVLSLRLPSVLSGAPIAPTALLTPHLGGNSGPVGSSFPGPVSTPSAPPSVPSPQPPAPNIQPQPGLGILSQNITPALAAIVSGALGGGQPTYSGQPSAPPQQQAQPQPSAPPSPTAPAPPPSIIFHGIGNQGGSGAPGGLGGVFGGGTDFNNAGGGGGGRGF